MLIGLAFGLEVTGVTNYIRERVQVTVTTPFGLARTLYIGQTEVECCVVVSALLTGSFNIFKG